MQGKIIKWKIEGGYGFIGPDEGQRVEFDLGTNPRNGKLMARNVKVLNPVLNKPSAPAVLDELDDATAHMQLGQTEFMRQRYE